MRLDVFQAIVDGVPSADKYLLAINKHVEWEKTQCETALRFLRACQLLGKAQKRKTILEAQRRDTERVVKLLEQKRVEFKNRCAELFDHSLEMQNDIIRRLREYWDAYRYCTLRNVRLDLDVAKPLSYLQKVCSCSVAMLFHINAQMIHSESFF